MSHPSTPARFNPYPPWSPRFWHGMLITDWLSLLAKQRWRVHPLRWGLATTVTVLATFNFKMRIAQTALLGHRIRHTPIPDNPIFVLGHWRSGTTLLQELLSVDDRLATPTTYQCFAANHFLLTEPIITRLLWFLIPSRRPMDNVASGWHMPQEDEFALCSMGLPSPYLRMAFPNTSSEYLEYLDMKGLDEKSISAWKAGLAEFLRRMALHQQKRLVLKSPTHTGRIGLLADMFPRAKFIHIIRNPYDVVPSTIRLWKSLDEVQGLQLPTHDKLESYVFRAYRRMYDTFEQDRLQLGPHQIVDVRYEDLVADGQATLARVYEQLELGDFARVRPRLAAALARKQDYQKNTHKLSHELIAKIDEQWSDYFERYGYPRHAERDSARNIA